MVTQQRDEYLEEARRLILEARERFRAEAELLIGPDDPTAREKVEALERAIGEVGPADAIAGLLRWMMETGRQPAEVDRE